MELNQLIDTVNVEEYAKIYEKILEEVLCKCTELPGASKLINHFHFHNVPLAICTGSDNVEFAHKTTNFQHWLEKIKLHVLSGSDPEVVFGKPHPDPYLVTLKRFETPPASSKNVNIFSILQIIRIKYFKLVFMLQP